LFTVFTLRHCTSAVLHSPDDKNSPLPPIITLPVPTDNMQEFKLPSITPPVKIQDPCDDIIADDQPEFGQTLLQIVEVFELRIKDGSQLDCIEESIEFAIKDLDDPDKLDLKLLIIVFCLPQVILDETDEIITLDAPEAPGKYSVKEIFEAADDIILLTAFETELEQTVELLEFKIKELSELLMVDPDEFEIFES
jgi:hypothetical protein